MNLQQLAIGAVCATGVVSQSSAGVLAPPAGPVAPTMKDLVEVEPRIAVNGTNTPGDANSLFRIDQPGSYYLTGNIINGALDRGIEIEASGVTLDLNGFVLQDAGVLNGIIVDGAQSRITILNGVVSGGLFGAVSLGGSTDSLVHGLLVSDSTDGLACVGARNTVRNCSITGCDSYGILIGANGLVESCVISGCGNGFNRALYLLGDSTRVVNCNVSGNDGDGIEGSNIVTDCQIIDCTVNDNTGVGILGRERWQVINCDVSGNGGNGIQGLEGWHVVDSRVSRNGADGMTLGDQCYVSRSVAHNNTGNGIAVLLFGVVDRCSARANGLDGIAGGNGSEVMWCQSSQNQGNGIATSDGGLISSNTVRDNKTNGIVVQNDALVIGNSLDGNDFVGILVTGTDNRIDGNNAGDGQWGVQVLSAGNLIVRNSASNNSVINYDIVAGNHDAQVLPFPGAGFVATNPWANFSY